MSINWLSFKKIKTVCFNFKALVIVLLVITVISLGLAVYFGINNAKIKKEFTEIGPQEKMEKLHSYAVVLEKFEQFKRQEGQGESMADLEMAVLATGSGVLKALFDDMIFGGNLEKDMDYFMDAVIDSLKFFSK